MPFTRASSSKEPASLEHNPVVLVHSILALGSREGPAGEGVHRAAFKPAPLDLDPTQSSCSLGENGGEAYMYHSGFPSTAGHLVRELGAMTGADLMDTKHVCTLRGKQGRSSCVLLESSKRVGGRGTRCSENTENTFPSGSVLQIPSPIGWELLLSGDAL